MDEPFNTTRLSLEELNQDAARKNLGGVIFVSILMVIGLMGNVHILYVYAFKFKSSNIRTFILWLGTIDLLVCLVGMPFIIYDLTHPLLFFATNVCKALRFFDYIMSFSSASTLILISIERYRKICVPLGRQLTLRMSKIACVCVLLFAICVSWPALVLYGHTTVDTENKNITGVQCYTDDRYKMTSYQTYFNLFLVGLMSLMLVVMIILYLLMGRSLFEHLRFRAHFKRRFRSKRYFYKNGSISNGNPVQSISHLVQENITNIYSLQEGNCSIQEEPNLVRNADPAPPGNTDKNETSCLGAATYNPNSVTLTTEESGSRTVTIEAITIDLNTNATSKRKSNNDPLKAEKENTRRITFILFMVTVVYIISFIPHLALKIVAFMKKDFLLNLNFSEAIAYNTFVWSFFVNSVANSFIYGFYDKKFREELKHIYCRGKTRDLTPKLNINQSTSYG